MSEQINLETVGRQYKESRAAIARRVIVCAGTGCVANGSLKVFAALKNELRRTQHRGRRRTGTGPLRRRRSPLPERLPGLLPDGAAGDYRARRLSLYVHVKPDDVEEIVEQTLVGNRPVTRLLYVDPATGAACEKTHEFPSTSASRREILGDCGNIDPEDIREYIAHGGYEAARRAFTQMTPEQICEEIAASGLRGRGGGGFPTGRKWDSDSRGASRTRSTSSATATRATPARSWTAASWKATRTACSRA